MMKQVAIEANNPFTRTNIHGGDALEEEART